MKIKLSFVKTQFFAPFKIINLLLISNKFKRKKSPFNSKLNGLK